MYRGIPKVLNTKPPKYNKLLYKFAYIKYYPYICALLNNNIMIQRMKDVTGEVYTRLTIISLHEGRMTPRGEVEKQVVVRCECGVEKVVVYKELKRGSTKSCGCLAKEQRRQVEKGDKFKNWTVLGDTTPYKDSKGNTLRRVKVQCKCEKIREVILDTLISGESKSCGCRGLDKVEKVIVPIPESTDEEQWVEAFDFPGYYVSSLGRIFSTNIERKQLYLNNKSRTELTINKVRIKINIAELIYKSFYGSWNKEENRLIFVDDNRFNNSLSNLFLAQISNNGNTWVSRAYSNMTSSVGSKGQRFKERTLSKKHIIDIYKQQEGLSYYLKLPMDLTGEDPLLSISIDRIDNDKDYEEGNIVLATRFENMGRRTATIEQMINLCNQLEYKPS